ncbi:MAG: phosphate ABC transporter ATP-binding protein [Verrucomicrobiota bacterium]
MSLPIPSSVEVRDLSVQYGPQWALRGVDVNFPAGEITALVGPSGCGKSTLLASINRLTDLVPCAKVTGSIRWGTRELLGKDVELLELRRRIGMVFQRPTPFGLSIRRNFLLPLREHRYPRDEIDDRIESALRDVGLWDEVECRLDQSALDLSGGQQQRLCIARALCIEPEVILFDEPCSALDPIASEIVEESIAALRDRLSVIIVTHNLSQARRLSDTMAIFWVRDGSGCMIESGPTADLFSSPKDPDSIRYLSGERG